MRKYWQYLKPYWLFILLAPLSMALEVAMDLWQPNIMSVIIDQAIPTGDIHYIIQLSLKMIGIALIGMIGGFGCIFFSSIVGQRSGAKLRDDLFRHIQDFSFSNLDHYSSSSLVVRLTNDINQLQQMVMMMLRMLIRAPLLFIGGIIMTVSINAKLALILLVTIPLLTLVLIIIIKKGFPLFSLAQKKLDRLNSIIQENLSAIRVVKSFVREKQQIERFQQSNQSLFETNYKAFQMMVLTMPLIMLIMNLSTIALLWFGGKSILKGSIQVGQIMAMIQYFNYILFALFMVAFFMIMISRAKASSNRVLEVLNEKVDIYNPSNPVTERSKKGKLQFQDVSFSFDDGSNVSVLSNVSFSIEPGEVVALMGATGSGKTTLVSLIPRLYDIQKGKIELDGVDVRQYDLTILRQSISLVTQDSILFSGTIRENIRWGLPEATDEEVEWACKMAQASDFINHFPDGFDTIIGQKGINLSGGQRQRLCIARALVRKPSLLILDDSLSAMDTGTEARIWQALKSLQPRMTILMIAQRISTIKEADKILLLDEGTIVSQGTHENLIQSSPLYRDIIQSQDSIGIQHG
ncbi:ABC transporter ATP-binding protein/permease [bacterium]|nr:ABC transporter ATP-binding protein/permease [bacterium]